MNVEALERPLTYEEERGKPMPSFNHAIAQTNLIGEFLKNRSFRIASELTLELEGRPYTPDISIYPRESKPVDWRHDEIRKSDPPVAVVEIASPTQGSQPIMDKLEVYFRNGVKSCWLVSPHIKNITIYGPDGQEHGFSSGIGKDPYTGLSADLAVVFS
jgi:Uma2 family endonuclease